MKTFAPKTLKITVTRDDINDAIHAERQLKMRISTCPISQAFRRRLGTQEVKTVHDNLTPCLFETVTPMGSYRLPRQAANFIGRFDNGDFDSRSILRPITFTARLRTSS